MSDQRPTTPTTTPTNPPSNPPSNPPATEPLPLTKTVYRPRGETLHRNAREDGPSMDTQKEAQDYGLLQISEGLWRSFAVETRTALRSQPDATGTPNPSPPKVKPYGRPLVPPASNERTLADRGIDERGVPNA